MDNQIKIFRSSQIDELVWQTYNLEAIDCNICAGRGLLPNNPWEDDEDEGFECDECEGEGELYVGTRKNK